MVDERNQRLRESARRIINNLTVVKASAQLLEHMATALPDDDRSAWLELLEAIVVAVNMATIEVGLLADARGVPVGDD